MESIVVLLSISLALLIGAISPGPSFVLVARTAIATSRRNGIVAALGMGVGGVLLGGLALLGLRALLMQVEWLYVGLKAIGGLYLIYLGFRLWRGADDPLAIVNTVASSAAGVGKSFWLALVTQLSNPKTAIVYGGIFAALLPEQPPLWVLVTLPPLIFVVETGWYGAVALAFSSARPRAAYLRSKRWIDRIAGSVMAALGMRLIVESGRPG